MKKNIFILIIIQNLLFFSSATTNAWDTAYGELDDLELLEIIEFQERKIREAQEQLLPDNLRSSEKEVEPIVQKFMHEDLEPSLACFENSLQKMALEQADFHSKANNKIAELVATLALFVSSNKIGMLKSQLITLSAQTLLPYLNTSLASEKCSFKLDRKLIKGALIEWLLSNDSELFGYGDIGPKRLELRSRISEILNCFLTIKPEIYTQSSNQGYILKHLNQLEFNRSPLGQLLNDVKADDRLLEDVATFGPVLCGACSDLEAIPLLVFLKSGCFTEGMKAYF